MVIAAPEAFTGIDPLTLAKALWPRTTFYKQQREIIESIWNDDETYVVAGNMLGKDYIAGRVAVLFFITRTPCRIFTTSVAEDHLDVLWGELNQAIDESRIPLTIEKGGTLLVKHHHIRKFVNGQLCKLSYIKGGTSPINKGEKVQGHHIAQCGDGLPRTMFMADEASGLLDHYYEMASSWANRMYIFGNAWPCENFFKRAVKGIPGTNDYGGDIPREDGEGFHRRVIKIRAVDSPNVRMGLLQKKAGKTPDNRILIPGVKPYKEYVKNLAMWSKPQQVVSLDADWYEGAEEKLFPQEWLKHSTTRAKALLGQKRIAKAIGIDPGQGVADTAVSVVDDLGLIELTSQKTTNPADVSKIVISTVKRYNVEWDKVFFDAGGGGYEHAGYLREMGYPARTISFGGAATREREPGLKSFDEKAEEDESKASFFNKRAEMYGRLSEKIDPSRGDGFGIPDWSGVYEELLRQMIAIPRRYDPRGRLWLPPKYKHDPDSTTKTIVELIGCSPDELDSLVVAVYGMYASDLWAVAGVG